MHAHAQGSSYPISALEESTGTTTATNEQRSGPRKCVEMLSNATQSSPCLHQPKLDIPGPYILTKAFCGGPQMSTPSLQSFELACRTVNLPRNRHFSYHASLVKKVVHLVRNPFDSIVSRMHAKNPPNNGQRGRHGVQVATREELLAWCEKLDQHFSKKFHKGGDASLPPGFVQKYKHAPCRAELFRYALWHTRAQEVTRRLGIPVHVVNYENYTTNATKTTHNLLDFLQLEAVRQPTPFGLSLSNGYLFQREERKAAAELVKDVASPEAWELISHYFDDDRADDPNPFPSIALFMTFPNSGTSYTLKNTFQVSNHTIASLYGTEGDHQMHHKLPDGPYLLNYNYEIPPVSILTKTHCGGYCDDCHPRGFVIPSTAQFFHQCRTGSRWFEGSLGQPTLNASLVSRAVHLFRDPFDNIIARMHLGVKRRRERLGWSDSSLAQFNDSRQGFLSWCTYTDGLFKREFFRGPFVSDEVKGLMEEVPCFMELFRWTQWHNRAIEVTREHKLPVHYLYYESYTTDFANTVANLLKFLQVPAIGEPLPFKTGKTYRHLYTQKEIVAASKLVQSLASPSCWTMIKHYFENVTEATNHGLP
eukprot:scaffold5944_cov101-Amphora_coffeaeformis.AAC.2